MNRNPLDRHPKKLMIGGKPLFYFPPTVDGIEDRLDFAKAPSVAAVEPYFLESKALYDSILAKLIPALHDEIELRFGSGYLTSPPLVRVLPVDIARGFPRRIQVVIEVMRIAVRYDMALVPVEVMA